MFKTFSFITILFASLFLTETASAKDILCVMRNGVVCVRSRTKCPPGERPFVGLIGPTGATGAAGLIGATGLAGATGLTGATGATGQSAVTLYGSFFALMPADNAATVAAGSAVDFPQDGPASGIARSNSSSFVLPLIGDYEVIWQVSTSEPGQLLLALQGIELAETVSGRATGTTQISGDMIVRTTVAASILSVQNPTGNPTALTITPLAGGTHPVAATLVIKYLGP
jgi:hypothetical protein